MATPGLALHVQAGKNDVDLLCHAPLHVGNLHGFAGDKDHEQLTEDLIHTCIEVVGGSRAIQLQLRLWLIKNAVLPTMPELSLASLRRIEAFDLLESYDQLRGIALALSTLIYGDSYFEQLIQAL